MGKDDQIAKLKKKIVSLERTMEIMSDPVLVKKLNLGLVEFNNGKAMPIEKYA